MTAFRRCHQGLKNLPDNLDFTLRLCNRYCGYLVFDGKYVNVKGYERGAVLLWGVDFLTHDPLHFTLAPSENYLACRNYFTALRRIGYPLQYLVCDDNDAIKMAARFIYPKVIIQTCLNHYLENIRRDLNIRSRPDYQDFFSSVSDLFAQRLELVSFTWKLFEIYVRFKDDSRCLEWISNLMSQRGELLAYHQFVGVPRTTNLIEAYNSHLEARLKSLRGFQSFASARLWLNGYILRRRLKPFTDCQKPFKHLNGKCSLENSLKRGLKIPKIFI